MTDLEVFVRLSTTLTGLSEGDLPAAVEQRDATGAPVKLAELYLQRLRAAFPVEVGELLATWRGVQLDPDAGARLSERLSASDAGGLRLRIAARQLIKIWFLSTIDDPSAALSKEGISAAQLAGDLGQFQHGAIWKLIGAPAQGYSNFPHGYWAEKPQRR